MIARTLLHTCNVILAASGLMAQSAPVRPAFEVASVKRNTTNGPWDQVPRRSGDHVTMHNTRLGNMLFYAYRIRRDFEMAGNLDLPAGWDWYDIDAEVEGSPSDDDLRLMFQSLLEDRFKLRAHRETREMAQYDLVPVKGGTKLAAADEKSKLIIDGKPLPKGAHGIFLGMDGAHLMGKAATMPQLLDGLISGLRAPVVDRTGLQGTFDYDVLFARDNRPEDNAPALSTAIQELGLKLEKSKGPVEVLVIDHVEKPSEN